MFESSEVRNVVLVTGANQFLAQHVIKLLHEKDEQVDEIRVFDFTPYENKLGHVERKPIVRFHGRFDEQDKQNKMMSGVKWIVNCAELVEHESTEEFDKCNVTFAGQVIEAAIAFNVPYLIHMSSIMVCCGFNSNYYSTEITTQVAKQRLQQRYGHSKYQSELLMERANGKPLGDGFGRLRTLTLRPTIMYGELDWWFVPRLMRVAQKCKQTLPRLSNIYIRLQPCYVGNVAWAVLCAKRTIEKDASVGGETFFVTDDTPISDPFDFCQSFLTKRGLSVSSWSIPLWFVLLLIVIVQFFIKLVRPIFKLKLDPEWNGEYWNSICTTHFFNRNKITLRLNYDPLYSIDEAHQRAQNYYESCSL